MEKLVHAFGTGSGAEAELVWETCLMFALVQKPFCPADAHLPDDEPYFFDGSCVGAVMAFQFCGWPPNNCCDVFCTRSHERQPSTILPISIFWLGICDVSVTGGPHVIEGMPPVHAHERASCIMHYLRVMLIAFCVTGGKVAQHMNLWICKFCSAPAGLAQGHDAAVQTCLATLLSLFLDDTYVAGPPERVATAHSTLQEAIWNHARIRLNAGKTRVWNAAGEEPPGIDHLQTASGGPVWTGAWSLPPDPARHPRSRRPNRERGFCAARIAQQTRRAGRAAPPPPGPA